ncbi:MAG: peptidylprolyl isomerase, partial [Planctomycetota bacterium]
MARKEAGNSGSGNRGVGTADTGRHRRGNSTSSKSARGSAPPTRKWLLIGITAGVLAVAAAGKWLAGTPTAQAQAPPTEVAAAGAAAAPPQHDVMAVVNGKDIRRPQLAEACVERFGEDALNGLISKRLIEQHCRRRGVTVTAADLDAEIDRMAKRFKLGREQWLELLQRERGVTIAEYKQDILWPMLALRSLAKKELTVEPAELRKAYEQRYGPAVEVRLLVVSNSERAAQLHRQLTARPDDFARLAMQHSEDVNSASIGGLIQPIRRHSGQPDLEQVAFSLEPGQVSAPIQVAQQFAILKCERRLQSYQRSLSDEGVQAELTEAIRDEKLRGAANNLFAELEAASQITNVYNDPQLRGNMPGVVALVNGERVTMQQLGEVCLAKHGVPVLEGEISRLLLEQELVKNNLTVSEEDLTIEMAHAAKLAGVTNDAGQPDLEQWIKLSTEQQGVSYATYVRDSVWPSAALKKLTRGEVLVTQEDLDKGFEANYGPRVRCRAIVLADLRRAQKVWAMARENESMEYFGDL